LIADSEWFNVDVDSAKKALTDVYEKYSKFVDGAKKQSHKSKTEYSFDKMKELLDKLTKDYPAVVQMKLPTLKKIELPSLKK
jgi:hypothetical protein